MPTISHLQQKYTFQDYKVQEHWICCEVICTELHSRLLTFLYAISNSLRDCCWRLEVSWRIFSEDSLSLLASSCFTSAIFSRSLSHWEDNQSHANQLSSRTWWVQQVHPKYTLMKLQVMLVQRERKNKGPNPLPDSVVWLCLIPSVAMEADQGSCILNVTSCLVVWLIVDQGLRREKQISRQDPAGLHERQYVSQGI